MWSLLIAGSARDATDPRRPPRRSRPDRAGGVTFQQLQKYERGTNRISASKLYELAQALTASPADFFGDLPGTPDEAWSAETRRLTALAQQPEGARLLTAFDRAPERVKGAVIELVEKVAG
ncbi:helix-turn-helix domain-containing protein [Caulobacter sp. NIBR2454]|uniref:helix-turn-helix domain-containing protein n=1 Tax=Caulobacter sp. NIBR2454 TaxID=3015996 RepID=UPI0022B6C179|nr:helix-turn-helix domain-containing protein [Caulobacter sp. NIBR2454]